MTSWVFAVSRARSTTPGLSDKQVPFVPLMTGTGSVTTTLLSGIAIMAGAEYSARRYTTFDNLPSLSTSPFVIAFVSLSTERGLLPWGIGGTIFVDNVTDIHFELVQGYPMPGRSIMCTFTMEVS